MRRAGRVGLIGVALALATALTGTLVVHADALRVHVNIAAVTEEREALAQVMSELLQRLGVEMVYDGSASGDSELLGYDPKAYAARVTISMIEPGYALLLVHDPARDRMVVKRVARTPGSEELVREELGHMMLAAVEALLAGASVGEPKEEAMRKLIEERQRELGEASESQLRERERLSAPAPNEPTSTPSPRVAPAPPQPEHDAPELRRADRAVRLRAAVLYEAALLGDEPGIAHGPALALALRSPWPLNLGVLGSVQYRFPLEVESDPVGLRTQAFSLRALATIEHDANARLALRFGLGGGADIARIEPQLAESAAARTTAKRTLALAVARALACVDWRMSPWVSLWVAVAADLDLDKSQYVLIDDDGRERTVSEPWRVRPSLLIGAALP